MTSAYWWSTLRVKMSMAGLAVLSLLLSTAKGQAQTTVNMVATGVSTPGNGVILSGSAINPNTGLPFRHHWAGSPGNGLCRLDPDVDTGGVAGPYNLNPTTCINSILNTVFKPGPITYDPLTNNIYAVDGGSKSQGIIRFHFLPAAGGGHGLLDTTRIEVVAANCGLGGNLPVAAALGPDGNLYVGFKKNGNIVRLVSPQIEPLPCGNIVTVGATADTKRDAGLAWVGHDLYGADGLGPWVLSVADQCATAGAGPCRAASLFAGLVNLPTTVLTDQTYPQTNGTTVYLASTNSVATVQVVPSQALNTNYATGFQFASGLTWDAYRQILWVGDDPSNGLTAGLGRWFETFTNLQSVQAPGTPVNVTATPGDSRAIVSWTRAADGQPITNFTVRTLLSDLSPSGVPDLTIGNVSATGISGLTNGTSYVFEVQAINTVGSSAFSTPSNAVTPQPPSPPAAPTGVSAVAGSGAASVSWTAPAANGSPLTAYTITAYTSGVPSGITATAAGSATNAIVTGLTNGTTYSFTVIAINAVGSSPESTPSNPVTPTPAVVDMAVSMTGPSAINSGTSATYTVAVVNNGPDAATQVLLTDNFAGARLTAAPVTSLGSCQSGTSTVTCNLGPMGANATATITITLTSTAPILNTATVQGLDAANSVLPDPNTLNNTASVTTAIAAPLVSTDLQVTGSAKTGGPAVGSTDIYTWQVKNGTSKIATGVVFTDNLPPQLAFQSVSSNLGSCAGPAVGSAGGTVTCNLDSLGTTGLIVNITVTVTAPGSIPNTGVVQFNGTDTNLSNNSFTVVVTAK